MCDASAVDDAMRQDRRADGPGPAPFSRRTMLRGLALAAGVGAFGLGGCRSADHAALEERLVALSSDREAARAIGRAFLDETSSSRRRLVARLAEELDWTVELDDAVLSERLLERIERDFRDGKTVQVQAWVLAQTEAWWAAVVALA